MDTHMTDRPVEAKPLLAEDTLRQIARHVKDHIPGNADGDIEGQKFKLISLLDEVLYTSSSIVLNASHRVAAWEALCTLIDQTIKSPHEHVRALLWQAHVWSRALNLYLDQSPNARPKSSKSLLNSLGAVLRKWEGTAWIDEVKNQLARQLVIAIRAKEAQRDSKAYLLLFTHFLSKNILSLDVIIQQINTADLTHDLTSRVESLLSYIFPWITRGDLGSIVGQLIGVILDKVDKAPSIPVQSAQEDTAAPVWSRPLHETLGCDIENTEAYRAHIFPVLFKRSLSQYVAFLKQVGFDHESTGEHTSVYANAQEILYAALQTGKHHGLIEETTGGEVVLEQNRMLVPISFIAQLTSSGDRSARLTGLSLFIASNSPTKPFQPAIFEQLKHALPHLHADTDSFSRSELFWLTQRMFDRMRSATAVLARTPSDSDKSPAALQSIQQHNEFIEWYARFIAWELRPTGSYQRHISALRCLTLLLRSGIDGRVSKDQLSKSASGTSPWPFEVFIVDSGVRRLLLDLLMNSFEEVRNTSASILELCASTHSTSGHRSDSGLEVAKERAITRMLSSGRADHADGVAYIHSLSYVLAEIPSDRQLVLTALLDKTEEMLSVADRDLAVAVDKFPLHGLLTSLRYVILRIDETDLDSQLHSRVASILQRVWSLVKPTLCDDAPEGHVPEDMDDVPDISTKDILSYCWRALKEASLLLGTMLLPALLKACTSPTDFKHSMFELCFTQLAELRHRGAFSTVAQTWTTCCSLMEGDGSLSLSAWYERTVDLLRKSLTINTRRSAGLPSLLCGVLIADRSGALFKRAFAEIEQIARQDVDLASAHDSSLTQVHAMNCMKDILKNTRLAGQSEQYIPVALRLAADSLRSEAWAIRNCGLMLFRAVIDRLLGTNDAYVEDEVATKRRVDFEHHFDLLELVIGLLSTAPTSISPGEGARNEGVFPALQLLQRAHIPESKRAEVQTAVFALTASPSWHVRDKAARTYVSFVPVETTSAVLQELLAGPKENHNSLHGALLCAMYLIRRLSTKVLPSTQHELAEEEKRCNVFVAAADWLRNDESCLYTSIAFVDVENSLEALNKRVSQSRQVSNAQFQYAIENAVIALEGDHVKVPSSDIGQMTETEAMGRITNQTEADQWLEDRATYIERNATQTESVDPGLLFVQQEWAQAAQTSLDDHSIFSRQAAVQGLSHFRVIWMRLSVDPTASDLFRSLCLTVYDLLNDDDEEIRIEAANTASKILAAHRNIPADSVPALVPLVATQQLAELLIQRWPDSADLFNEAVHRAFGTSAKSVQEHLDTFEKAEYALFAEEKQNLYIDDVREVQVWANVALRLSPQARSLETLQHWTLEGLRALTAKFSETGDGALGWSTNENAFLLGLRILHAADVLLRLGQGASDSVESPGLKSDLNDLMEAAKTGKGNVLWITEAKRVLADGSSGT